MKLLFAILALLYGQVLALDTLTAAQAVKLGLENNYNIRIARNNIVKASNMNKLKAGSLFPTARADGSVNYTNTKYASSSSAVKSGLGSYSDGLLYSAGASLNWTLFDGFKMFYAFKQLEQQTKLTKHASRHDIESSVVRVLTAFYNLGSARSLLAAVQQQLALSRTQIKHIKTQHEFGGASNREILRQQVLINADSALVAIRELDAVKALHALNLALGKTPDEPLEIIIDTTIKPFGENAAFWFEKAKNHNTGLKISEIQKNISYSELEIARSSFWPVLAANGAYSRTWGDRDYSRSSVGLSINWPIFAGFRTLTNAQNALIDSKNAELSYKQMQQELQAYIYQQWELMTNSYRQVEFERKAVTLAEQSIAVSHEQYKLGRLSGVQFRESQLSLTNAQVRLETALFQYKVTTIQLQQLAGMLAIK